MEYHIYLLFLFILILQIQACMSWPSWGWNFFSGHSQERRKGIQLVENAKRKLVSSNSCWQRAYQQIFVACSEMIADDSEKRKRFAWDLSNCFQNDSGRPYFPHCKPKSSMQKCLAKLDDISYQTYLQFFLETNSICYQLQATAFRLQTENLVNDLKSTAHTTQEKLLNMEMKTERLLQSSDNVVSSLETIDQHSQQVAETTKNVSYHMDVVVEKSMAVFDQSQQIAAFQSELKTGQQHMNSKLEDGMATLNNSYKDLGERLDDIKDETAELEKKLNKLGDAMSEKMITLQGRADDIGKMAGISLGNQKELIEKQSTALEGLQSLTEFQSQALAESRSTLKELAEFGQRQPEMLLQRQKQLEQAHDHLVENSKFILAAQEAFELKQSHMFAALDKLFSLHNAMLVESRTIKAFFLYCLTVFVLYVLTSTKQTYTVRPRLYIGLCASFVIETAIIRYSMNDTEQQTWLINLVRLVYMMLASMQLLFAIYTYRDYEMLNHQMLHSLIEKVNSIRENSELAWDTDSDVDWSSWVDTELSDDVDSLKDPDYMLDQVEAEGSSEESSIATSTSSRKYDLRLRRGC